MTSLSRRLLAPLILVAFVLALGCVWGCSAGNAVVLQFNPPVMGKKTVDTSKSTVTEVSDLIREAFLSQYSPDLAHQFGLVVKEFEDSGRHEDAVLLKRQIESQTPVSQTPASRSRANAGSAKSLFAQPMLVPPRPKSSAPTHFPSSPPSDSKCIAKVDSKYLAEVNSELRSLADLLPDIDLSLSLSDRGSSQVEPKS